MLIWIDASVLNADLASDNDACLGVTGIFDAVYRGEHYALGTRATLSALAGNCNLSPSTRRTVGTVLSNLSTLGGIADKVVSRVNVTYGHEKDCGRLSPSIAEISLGYLGVHGVKKSVLLAENLDDARAFEHAARQYQISVGIPGQVALEKSGGGGSTTPRMFRNFAQVERRWCLCITDSDRLHPNARMCDTAQKCAEIANINSVFSVHIDLCSREIENILPIVFLNEVVPRTHQDKWDWHVNKLYKLRPDAHGYCDIKRGMTLRRIREYSESSRSRIYWEEVAKDLEKAAALTNGCVEFGECACDSEAHCLCHMGYGIGERVLESVVEKLDSRTAHISEKMARKDCNISEWTKVGRSVFEWCCAPQKTRL